jgi:hypothetical protein
MAVVFYIFLLNKKSRMIVFNYVFTSTKKSHLENALSFLVYVGLLIVMGGCLLRHILIGSKRDFYHYGGILTDLMSAFIWIIIFLLLLGNVSPKNKNRKPRLIIFLIISFVLCTIDLMYYFGVF